MINLMVIAREVRWVQTGCILSWCTGSAEHKRWPYFSVLPLVEFPPVHRSLCFSIQALDFVYNFFPSSILLLSYYFRPVWHISYACNMAIKLTSPS